MITICWGLFQKMLQKIATIQDKEKKHNHFLHCVWRYDTIWPLNFYTTSLYEDNMGKQKCFRGDFV
jgi:hypothetical protein